ncbi:uncharacterized protein clos isoform X2 [Eurosta solidaginis]|uniref:uncharacterized protein clos isoform X2 n=1 Tax=Eurosta solidaginis TaxID=178769 RepID=UPI003531293B
MQKLINMFLQILILIFINCVIDGFCFHVNFHEFYGAQLEPFNTQIQKREMASFFDKAAYSFNGLEKIESVPVLFPIDICILSLDGAKYAASLHKNKNGERHFTIYKNVNQTYKEVYTTAMPNVIAMDCTTLGTKAYIALAFNLTKPIENAREGSPIYQISADDRLRAVQFFATLNLYSIYLRTTANDLFMLQTFQSNNSGIATNKRCPYYIWSGTSFTLLGRIPCSNARHVEPFAINYENYVALANYANANGRTTTYSEIYKFVQEKKRFQLIQKIRTYGAVDVRYFRVPLDEMKRRHFLVFGNSVSRRKSASGNGDRNEADSVFYVYDKGQFVPYQSLSLYAVEQFLPVQNTDAEKFMLLVASKNQDTKIFNLNDWKFEPSNVQFTEGALGQGVSKMRIYQENEKSYLVIANEKMTENDTNIFLPIFKQDEHANALRQQIIDWTKAQIQRLSQIDISKLKSDVEQKLTTNQRPNINMQVQVIPKSNIQTVRTNSFVSPKHHFTTEYWQALHYATQAVNALDVEIKLAATQRLKRATNITSTTDPIEKFANIKVDALVIKDKLSAQRVNGIEAKEPAFERIKAKKVRVTSTAKLHAPTLAVKHLQINGHLNNQKWNDLQNDTLKRYGMQFMQQTAHIDNLVAESVLVINNEIDGNNLNRLIPIGSDGDNNAEGSRTYVVNQSIRFEVPVKTKNLLIHEHLNQIHVHKNKLDVLLKHTNMTQVVVGSKRLENVRILQPITMAGQTLGARLQSMSPHQIIHDDLILNGDFTINGDAVIFQALHVEDLIDLNSKISAKQTLLNGIDITKTLEDVNIRFENPLIANNTEITFINGIDMQQLIKTNFKHLQVIEGEKYFKETLEVQSGFSEVKSLNGIDIENLSESLLFKSLNQSIKVPMHFSEIQAHTIQAPNITMNDKPLEAYVKRTGKQHLPITLIVSELNAQTLKIEKLNTTGEYIFDKAMIAKDEQQPHLLSNATAKANEFLTSKGYFPNTIFVGNLRLNDVGKINGRNMSVFEKQLQQLNADINFEGNYKFNYNMNISHLTYRGTLNDIPAKQFGRSWLQKNGTQVFTASQSLSKVDCLQGVQLDGTLNGHAIDAFYEKTYWINRNEFIDAIEFKNPIQMQAPFSTITLNGIHVPLDIINANSSIPQILYAGATIKDQLNIIDTEGIYNVSTLNGVNLLELQQFLKADNGDTLHVEQVNFIRSPFYQTFNRHILSTLLDSVWLANENVRLSQHVELANTTFEGLLEFEGHVNNLNMHYLKDNYLSLSRPQEINTELILADEAKFEGDLTATDVHLSGLLMDNNSNSSANLNEFVANTLKTDGPHEIRARWSIKRTHIQGDLENVQINNLNLINDVLRLDVPYTPILAPKTLKTVTIQKLYSTPSTTINDVPMVDWLHNTVYITGNHTVKGNIFLDTVNIYNDLTVLGAVNNISNFGEKTLLLRNIPQNLHGDVYINNLSLKDRRILVNNIENLVAKYINKELVNKFYEKQAKMSPTVAVEGNLVFMQPLVVQNYRNQGVSEWKSKRNCGSDEVIVGRSGEVTQYNLQSVLEMVQQLKISLREPYYKLSGFLVRQKLSINATKVVHFQINGKNNQTKDFIGTVNAGDNNTSVQYYQWLMDSKQFQPADDITWLPKIQTFIDILALLSNNYQVVKLNETIASYLLSILKPALQTRLGYIPQSKSLAINGESCFMSESIAERNSTLIYCIKDQLEVYEKYVLPRKSISEVQQIALDKIALLLQSGIEIWRIQPSLEYLQSLSAVNATKMAIVENKSNTYLALHIENISHETVEIYRWLTSAQFEHVQSLDCMEPIQMSFSALPLTGDLMLYILRNNTETPLTIYQHKGVLGFERLLAASTLPVIQTYHVLHLKDAVNQIIVLLKDGELLFVEITLSEF